MRDERLVVGFVALHLLVAAPGLALLYALGLIRPRPVELLAATGPAFALGVIVAGVPLIALLVLGVSIGSGLSVAVVVVMTLLLGAVALRRRPWQRRGPPVVGPGDPPSRVELVVERVALAALALYLVFGALAFSHVPTMWDDANIWSLKGLGLYYHDGLVDGLGRNTQLSGVHLDYPVLQPLLEASMFRAIGAVDLRLWHLELWVVLAALVWTLAWLLASFGRRWVWVFVVALLPLSGVVISNITLGDADAVMAAMIGCAALSFGLWLERGQRAHALLGAVFLAGAGNVKNEGLAFGLAIAVALVAAVLLSRPRERLRELAASAGIVVACLLPWQLWVVGNQAATRSTQSPWQLIDEPDYLLDRSEFLWRGLKRIVFDVTNTAEWALLVPAFLVVGAVLIIVNHRRAVASFYLLASLLAGMTVAYTYWVTPFADLGGFEQRTGPRIVLGVVFIAAAGLAHLLQVAGAVGPADEVREDEPEASARQPVA